MRKKKNNRDLDIRDICYFVDHVKNYDLRISIIENLGYKLGVNVAKDGCMEKEVTIGKRNELRVQITPKTNKTPLVICAIVE